MLLWDLVLFGVLQGSPLQERPAPTRDYAVYNVVLDSLPENANRRNALVTNRTITRDPSFRRTVLRTRPTANPGSPLVDSLASGAGAFAPHVLDSTALGPGVRFITDSTFRSFFQRDPRTGWMAFRERYPDVQGVIELSNVAYDPGGDSAVVYVAVKCGPLCGWGGLYFLARTGQVWTIARIQMEWVS